MATLYKISDDMMAFNALIEEVDGDVSGAEDIIEQWFKENKDQLAAKADAYVAIMKDFVMRADAKKAEAKRLSEEAKFDLNKAKSLKGRLQQFMDLHDIKEIKTDLHILKTQANGGKTPIEFTVDPKLDPETIPERFRDHEMVITVNQMSLRAYLDLHKDVDFREVLEMGKHFKDGELTQEAFELYLKEQNIMGSSDLNEYLAIMQGFARYGARGRQLRIK